MICWTAGHLMYHYRPPKSSIWGHRLGRLSTRQAKEGLERFLERAAGVHEFGNGALSVLRASRDGGLARQLLAVAGEKPYHLDAATTSRCLTMLVEWEDRNRCRPESVSLLQSCAIREWKMPNGRVGTNSLLLAHYAGMLPCISTFLEFDSIESFEFVREVFAELLLFKLSPKHLKPARRPKQKPPRSSAGERRRS